MWWTRLTDCLRIFTGCGGRSLRIVYRFAPDLGEQACGLFMDLDRISGRRLTDCLRIFSGCGGRGFRIVYGFLPDVGDEAYGWFTDFYRIWGRRLADCLWIWTGFGGEGLRIVYGSRFEFLLWGREPILYQSIKIPNLSHYKMMVLNPQRITENDVILLQNEDCFLSWGYLKGKFHHYKMTICFIIKLLEGDTPPLQNEDWFFYAFIIRLLEGKTSILQNGDWKWLESMRLGFHMLPSEGQLTLLQNEIGFLHVVFRWANSLTTKWLSIFKGLSTTETLKTHKMRWKRIKCNSQALGTKCLAHPHSFMLI